MPEPSRERRRGLVRALQRRDVDRVDRLVLEAVGEQLGLAQAHRMQRGVAVTVAERERTARDLRLGLAVPHDQHGGRAGRRDEAVLPDALFIGTCVGLMRTCVGRLRTGCGLVGVCPALILAHAPRLRCGP